MDNVFFSILLVLIGLFVGIIVMIIFNYIKNANAESKAEKMIENAKKEAEKAKADENIEALTADIEATANKKAKVDAEAAPLKNVKVVLKDVLMIF